METQHRHTREFLVETKEATPPGKASSFLSGPTYMAIPRTVPPKKTQKVGIPLHQAGSFNWK